MDNAQLSHSQFKMFYTGFFNFVVFIFSRVTSQLRGNVDMNGLQALYAAIQCTPIPPRRRNRGLVDGGTGDNNSRVRSISGLRGTVNGDPDTRESDENTTQQDSTTAGILPICNARKSTDAIEADACHFYSGSDNHISSPDESFAYGSRVLETIIDKEALKDLTGGEEKTNAGKLNSSEHESADTDRSMAFGKEEEKSCSMDTSSTDEESGKIQNCYS